MRQKRENNNYTNSIITTKLLSDYRNTVTILKIKFKKFNDIIKEGE